MNSDSNEALISNQFRYSIDRFILNNSHGLYREAAVDHVAKTMQIFYLKVGIYLYKSPKPSESYKELFIIDVNTKIYCV